MVGREDEKDPGNTSVLWQPWAVSAFSEGQLHRMSTSWFLSHKSPSQTLQKLLPLTWDADELREDEEVPQVREPVKEHFPHESTSE